MHIRTATVSDSAGLAKVHVDAWKTTYHGIVPGTYLDGLTYEKSTQRWEKIFATHPDNYVLVAVNEDGMIVGFVSCGVNRDSSLPYDAELHAIYILKEEQQRGIGRALIQAFAKMIAAEGRNSFVVWVLADNAQARRFYEAMDGVIVSSKQIEIGGSSLEEIAYAWTGLESLTGRRN